jgi:hypothetical protein
MDWFRYYHDALDDPKVQGLSGDLFKAWINLLSIASGAKPRGALPSLSEIAFRLRLSDETTADIWATLTQAGLFDQNEAGQWMPHNWGGRQKRSDSSTPRVQAHREMKRFGNGHGNGSETPQREEKKKKKNSQVRSSSSSPSGENAPPSARSQASPRSPPDGAPTNSLHLSDEEIAQWLKNNG